MIDRFREEVYQRFSHWADAGLDLIDELTGSLEIESPVATGESPLDLIGHARVALPLVPSFGVLLVVPTFAVLLLVVRYAAPLLVLVHELLLP